MDIPTIDKCQPSAICEHERGMEPAAVMLGPRSVLIGATTKRMDEVNDITETCLACLSILPRR